MPVKLGPPSSSLEIVTADMSIQARFLGDVNGMSKSFLGTSIPYLLSEPYCSSSTSSTSSVCSTDSFDPTWDPEDVWGPVDAAESKVHFVDMEESGRPEWVDGRDMFNADGPIPAVDNPSGFSLFPAQPGCCVCDSVHRFALMWGIPGTYGYRYSVLYHLYYDFKFKGALPYLWEMCNMTFNWFDNCSGMVWYPYVDDGDDFKCAACGENIWQVPSELLDQMVAADNDDLYFPLYTDNELF